MKWIFLALALGLSFFYFRPSQRLENTAALSLREPHLVKMRVEGMTCGHCAKSITAVLEKKFEARDVEVAVKTGAVHFVTEHVFEDSAVVQSIEDLGFSVHELETNPAPKSPLL